MDFVDSKKCRPNVCVRLDTKKIQGPSNVVNNATLLNRLAIYQKTLQSLHCAICKVRNTLTMHIFSLQKGWGRQRGRGTGASAPPRCPVLPRFRGGAVTLTAPFFDHGAPFPLFARIFRIFWSKFYFGRIFWSNFGGAGHRSPLPRCRPQASGYFRILKTISY